jgi:hypothetical protein
MDIFNVARRIAYEKVPPGIENPRPETTSDLLNAQLDRLAENGWAVPRGIAILPSNGDGGAYWVGLVAPWMKLASLEGIHVRCR